MKLDWEVMCSIGVFTQFSCIISLGCAASLFQPMDVNHIGALGPWAKQMFFRSSLTYNNNSSSVIDPTTCSSFNEF